MKLLPFCVESLDQLEDCLQEFHMHCPKKYKSILAYVFSSNNNPKDIRTVVQTIHEKVPRAKVAGCTSSGEILHGRLKLNTILLSFLVFDAADVEVMMFECQNMSMAESATYFLKHISGFEDLRGVGLLSTIETLDHIREFTDRLEEIPKHVVIYGGSADAYVPESKDSKEKIHEGYSCIFDGENITDTGLIAIIFRGNQLNMHVNSYLGWKPLGMESVITEMRGYADLCTLNHEPAAETYKKYLGISAGPDFFETIIPFPMIMERDGKDIARIPSFCYEDGVVRFSGDMEVGEKVRLGYGDPNAMLCEARESLQCLREFAPEAILLFSCIARRMYLHNDVNIELPSYQEIAPTAGFYTHGEMERFHSYSKVHLLNGALVSIAFREGDIPENHCIEVSPDIIQRQEVQDKRVTLVKGLANFVTVISQELAEANAELSRLADTDRLTKLLNRGAGEAILKASIQKLNREGGELSVVMVDLDHFKRINDTFGHETGDVVLQKVSRVMQEQVRDRDYVARWGGEEFLIILTGCLLESAVGVAERIRSCLENTVKLVDGSKVTASFGVAKAKQGENMKELYRKLDEQLYIAKEKGRNCVMVADWEGLPKCD